jgi:hypothetical protein
MEETIPYETSVDIQQAAPCYVSEYRIIQAVINFLKLESNRNFVREIIYGPLLEM